MFTKLYNPADKPDLSQEAIKRAIEDGVAAAPRLSKPDSHELHKYVEHDGKWWPIVAVEEKVTCGTPAVMEAQEGVGNVDSDAKGSGARFNTGKVPLELIPIEQLIPIFESYDVNGEHEDLLTMLEHLSRWQQGDDECLAEIMGDIEWDDIEEAAHVWLYGARKYAAWNWAKGMAWSIPVACILRHCRQIIVMREEIDEESGRSHRGHVVCNLMMLDHFSRYFRKGDDRPSRVIFEEA